MEIQTPLGDDVLLFYRMHGKEELGRLSECELDLLSTRNDIAFDQILGKSVTVKLELQKDGVRHFNGYVTRIAQVGVHGRHHLYRATVRPWLWFLTRTATCRIFQDKTVPDIIKEIFNGHGGLVDVKFDLTASYRPWGYCVQYRETDFDFVSRLMEHEGIYYYFQHREGRHTLVLADSSSAHSASAEEEISFIALGNGARPGRDYISEWAISRELQPARYALTDYDFEKPRADLQVKSKIKRDHALAEYEIYDYPGHYSEHDAGERYARTRVEELQAKFERAEGTTNVRELATGYLFKLDAHSRSDQNTEYLVVSTEYQLQTNEYEATGERGATYTCKFTALNSRQAFRPERLTDKPIVQGPQTAMVVGPNGEDIYTDKFGRIKVRFHWDRTGKRDENSSCWIRVSQNWGGKGWGGMFIPHTGQEVIVEFLEGDPDRPLVTGRVYNAENMPPVELPAGKTQSIIRDHGGNEIIMQGTAGGQQMRLFSPHAASSITIGAPSSPAGIRASTDAFLEWQVGKSLKINVKENIDENVVGYKKTSIDGDKREVIAGTEQKRVIGTKTEYMLGSEFKFVSPFTTSIVVGAKTDLVGGAKTDVIGGVNTKIHRGPRFESQPAVYETATQKVVKADKELTKHEELVNLISGICTEKIGSLEQKIGSLDQRIDKWVVAVMGEISEQAASVEQKIKGSTVVDTGDYTLRSKGGIIINTKAGLFLEANGNIRMKFTGIQMNGSWVDMKDGTLKVT
jgi:type VI secretion system secreted protein VgrG